MALDNQTLRHFHAAVQQRNIPLMTALMHEYGRSILKQPLDGKTALFHAVSRADAEATNWLIRAGADIDEVCQAQGELQPIHVAAMHGYFNVLKLLHGSGASLEARDGGMCTPLVALAWMAAHSFHNSHVDCIIYLAEKGADINACDYGGRTSLMWMAHAGAAKGLDTLLALGADEKLLDDRGQNAMDYAIDSGNIDAYQAAIARKQALRQAYMVKRIGDILDRGAQGKGASSVLRPKKKGNGNHGGPAS